MSLLLTDGALVIILYSLYLSETLGKLNLRYLKVRLLTIPFCVCTRHFGISSLLGCMCLSEHSLYQSLYFFCLLFLSCRSWRCLLGTSRRTGLRHRLNPPRPSPPPSLPAWPPVSAPTPPQSPIAGERWQIQAVHAGLWAPRTHISWAWVISTKTHLVSEQVSPMFTLIGQRGIP